MMSKHTYFSSCFLVLAFLLTGCRENYLAEKEFFKAKKVLQNVQQTELTRDPEKSFAPAIQALERVSERYPMTQKAAESLFLVAELRAKENKYEEARTALRKLIPNFTGKGEWASEARFRIGQLYEMEGKWKEAEETFWETAEYHAVQPRGLYAPIYVLNHYQKLKDPLRQQVAYEKSIEHYQRLLRQMGPIEASSRLKNSLALVHLSQGKGDSARAEWLSIVESFPDSPYAPLALLTIAELSWKQKDFEQSFLDYGQFLERYPRHPLASKTAVRMGLLYHGRKDFPNARTWFEKAIGQYFQKDQRGTADLKLLIGKTYQDEDRWEEADKMYRELDRTYPETSAALQVPLMRFIHLQSGGETQAAHQILDEAIRHYKQLIREKPKSKLAGYAKRSMFAAYTQKKDWDQLMANADQEIKNETDPEKKGRWLFLKALVTENRLRDREQALQLYQDFLAQYPDHHLSQLAKSHLELLARS